MFGKRWGWVAVTLLAVLFLVCATAGAANRDFSKINTVKMGVLAPVQMPVGHGDHECGEAGGGRDQCLREEFWGKKLS